MAKKQKNDSDFYVHQTGVMVVLALLLGGAIGFVFSYGLNGGTGEASAGVSSAVASTTNQQLYTKANAQRQETQLRGDGLVLREALSSEVQSIGKQQLSLLAEGYISNDFGNFKYTQSVNMPDAMVNLARVDEDYIPESQIDIPSVYLVFSGDGSYAYEHSLDFSTPLITEHRTEGASLYGLEGKAANIMGNQYYVVDTDHIQQWYVALDMMTGKFHNTLNEKGSKSYQYGGVTYLVKVEDITDDGTVKFKVNGEYTPYLSDGDVYALAGGINIGAYKVTYLQGQKALKAQKVDFFFVAHTLLLEDASTNQEGSGYMGGVTLDGITLSNVNCEILSPSDEGTQEGSRVEISGMKIAYYPSEDFYLSKNTMASVVADQVEGEAGNFLLNNFDITQKGIEDDSMTDIVSIYAFDSRNYEMDFRNNVGQDYEMFIAAGMQNIFVYPGEYTDGTFKRFRTFETQPIKLEDTFATSKGGYTNIFRLKTIDNTHLIIKVEDLSSLELYEITYSGPDNEGTLTVNGNSFKFRVPDYDPSQEEYLYLDMNGDSDYDDTNVLNNPDSCITTYSGGKILVDVNSEGDLLSIQMPDGECEYPSQCTVSPKIVFEYKDGTLSFDPDKLDQYQYQYGEGPEWGMLQYGEDYMYHGYTPYGTFVDASAQGPSWSDQWDVEIEWPEEQLESWVYVVGTS